MAKQIKDLTPAQEAKLEEYKNYYIDLFFNNKKEVDMAELTEYVNWVYSLCDLKAPQVILVDSPEAILKEYQRLSGNEKITWVEPSYYLSAFNSWIGFYDFFDKELGIIQNDLYQKFKKVLDLNIFWAVTLEDYCIVSRNAISYKRKASKLHGEDCPAIKFRDGYALYMWNGVPVPEKLIMNPDQVTKKDIMSESNAEVRRCYMEKLGAKKYYDILSDGKGLKLIDEDIDNQGHPMKLYETTSPDEIANATVQFLEVIDPSTGRMYNIYPPSQNCKNVWEAKADTFSGEKLFVRHGDVGLVNLNKVVDKPIMES